MSKYNRAYLAPKDPSSNDLEDATTLVSTNVPFWFELCSGQVGGYKLACHFSTSPRVKLNEFQGLPFRVQT
jgi:hypothetical protein